MTPPQGILVDRLTKSILSWSIRLKIAWQVCLGVDYLFEMLKHDPSMQMTISDLNLKLVDYLPMILTININHILLNHQYDVIIIPPLLFFHLGPETSIFFFLFSILLRKNITIIKTKNQLQVDTAEIGLASLGKFLLRLLNVKILQTPFALTISDVQNQLEPEILQNWPQSILLRFIEIACQCFHQQNQIWSDSPSSSPSLEFQLNSNQTINGLRSILDDLQSLMDEGHEVCQGCLCAKANGKLKCGHQVLCHLCVQYMSERGDACPLCRHPIS